MRAGRTFVLSAAAGLLAVGAAGAPPFRGCDGGPLPFTSSDQVEEFLRMAAVVSWKELSSGRTRPWKLRLERDGVSAHAVFRYVDSVRRRVRLEDGSYHHELRDSYRNDLAAYALDRLLGFEGMPPVVERAVGGRRGSVQLWIESARTEGARRRAGDAPPDPAAHDRQLHMMSVFDALIANIDRNPGNALVDPQWRVWFIDHTRSFARHHRLGFFDTGMGIDAGVWRRLAGTDDEAIRRALRPWVGSWEIGDLLERRREIVARFRAALELLGPLNAFFRAPGRG